MAADALFMKNKNVRRSILIKYLFYSNTRLTGVMVKSATLTGTANEAMITSSARISGGFGEA